jgi:hypothetical protein
MKQTHDFIGVEPLERDESRNEHQWIITREDGKMEI